MHPKDRQKMCTSCDGRIPFDADVCPYCSAQQVNISTMPKTSKELHHQSLQDSLTALYTPSYSGKSPSFLNSEKKEFIPKAEPLKDSMADKRFQPTSPPLGVPTIPVDVPNEQHSDEGRTSFWPLLWLSIGANLLTVGLLQLFFSDQGFLRLEWDSSYWFVYCLAALPLFFFGFKKANALK